jgi:hypothetical protein
MGYLQFCRVNFVWRSERSAYWRLASANILPLLSFSQTASRPADAKETAVVFLSGALLFASLAVRALATER